MKKRKNNLLINILLIFVGLIIISSIYSFLILEVVSFDMHLNVENRAGFNVTDVSIEFGTVYPGGGGFKEIFIQNKEYKKTRVVIKAYGDLKDWVSVSDNNFILKQNEYKKLKVEVNVPYDAEYKQYYGKLKIIFMRF